MILQYDSVRPPSVAVFRALNLGDMLCSMPAFKALRAAFPGSHIALIGLDSAAPVVERNTDCIDELIRFPGDPAFPEQNTRHNEVEAFYDSMANRRFDLVVQMHGSGLHSNHIVQRMRPRKWAGFVPDAALAEHGRLMPWPDHLPETQRYLALLAWMGIPVGMAAQPSLTPTMHDDAEAERLLNEHGLTAERMVLMHPGARLASRRWPLERYATVARSLIDDGWQVAMTGAASEKDLYRQLRDLAGEGIVDLSGQTSLGSLAALLCRARLLICNDTGVSHVAAAVGAHSVVIASGSDVRRWAPADTRRHVVLHWDTPCRPCLHPECPYGHPCARGVTVEQVIETSLESLKEDERVWS